MLSQEYLENIKARFLPIDQLNKLSTQRLLTYFRKIRRNTFNLQCGLCERVHTEDREEYDLYDEYCETIKKILNTREHIPR